MKTNKKGFTLIELVIAMAITTIVLSILVFVFTWGMRTYQTQQKFVNLQDSLRTSGMVIEKDIRASTQVLTITATTNCYTLTDDESNINKYCLIDNVLTRNDVPLMDHLHTLEITQTSGFVRIYLAGTYEGKELHYEQNVYLRNNS